jgi:hypothetical protein
LDEKVKNKIKNEWENAIKIEIDDFFAGTREKRA